MAKFSKPLQGIGYGNTKWDMNPSEVIAAQGNGAHLISPEKYKDNFGKVQIDNVSIGSGLYTVTFLFNSADRLVQTNVASNEKKMKVSLRVNLAH